MICLLFNSSRQTNQIHLFVFWENLQLTHLLFEINWPLCNSLLVSKISKFSLLTSPLLFKFLTFCLRLKKSRPAFSAETVEPAGVRLRWATWLCTFGSLINWEKFSLEMWRYFLLNYSRRQTLPKTFSRTEQLNWSKQAKQQAKCPKSRQSRQNFARN